MQLFDKLQPYWPVVAASLFFLLFGLWWRCCAARAMEQSPKYYAWVRRYRSGGFPFRRELLGSPKLQLRFLLTVLAAAGALALGRLANEGMLVSGRADGLFSDSHRLLELGLRVLGAGAVYCLLTLLFERPWVSVPGALLFAASAARDPGGNALLALALLGLLLYLRAERPGFPAELLYSLSVVTAALAAAAQPALVWLLPCLPLTHWYKLLHQLHSGRLSGKGLLLSLAVALLSWALAAGLGALLHPLLADGGRVPWFAFSTLRHNLSNPLWDAVDSLALPSLTGAVDLMLEAPLLGFGLWGCCSAWVLARKRRNVRGWFVLAVLAATVLLWLLTRSFPPTLGLTLSAACILRDADLGQKRGSAVAATLLGLAWYLFVQTAAWALPLAGALQQRLI